MDYAEFVKRIQEALGTEATGEALIEIVRQRNENAKELASYHNFDQDEPFNIDIARDR